MNKLRKKQRQIIDFFEHPIDLGDVVLVAQQGNLIPGKILSINETSISLSCERSNRTFRQWNHKTQQTEDYTSVAVTNGIPWLERLGITYIKRALARHNGHKYICLNYKEEAQPHIINLTKLNIYHETPEN